LKSLGVDSFRKEKLTLGLGTRQRKGEDDKRGTNNLKNERTGFGQNVVTWGKEGNVPRKAKMRKGRENGGYKIN